MKTERGSAAVLPTQHELNASYRFMLDWLKRRKRKAATNHHMNIKMTRNQLAGLLAEYAADIARTNDIYFQSIQKLQTRVQELAGATLSSQLEIALRDPDVLRADLRNSINSLLELLGRLPPAPSRG
jgi:hypothetical protein